MTANELRLKFIEHDKLHEKLYNMCSAYIKANIFPEFNKEFPNANFEFDCFNLDRYGDVRMRFVDNNMNEYPISKAVEIKDLLDFYINLTNESKD